MSWFLQRHAVRSFTVDPIGAQFAFATVHVLTEMKSSGTLAKVLKTPHCRIRRSRDYPRVEATAPPFVPLRDIAEGQRIGAAGCGHSTACPVPTCLPLGEGQRDIVGHHRWPPKLADLRP